MLLASETIKERNDAMDSEKLSESEEARDVRESIEEMERELAGMDKDIEDAKNVPNSEMREVAVNCFEQMRSSTIEMIALFKETYKAMLESDELAARLFKEEAADDE